MEDIHYLQNFPDRSETHAVRFTGTMLPERLQMSGGAVAFMTVKAIDGILLMEFNHQAVTSHFGKDGSGRNAGMKSVSIHHRLLNKLWMTGLAVFEGKLVSVYEAETLPASDAVDRLPHTFHSSLEDIMRINISGRDIYDPESQSVSKNLVVELIPPFGTYKLAVIEAFDLLPIVQDHRRAYHRTCQSTPSRFIDSHKERMICEECEVSVVELAHRGRLSM